MSQRIITRQKAIEQGPRPREWQARWHSDNLEYKSLAQSKRRAAKAKTKTSLITATDLTAILSAQKD